MLIESICLLASLSGSGIGMILSNRPGLTRAGSTMSILFVAASTTTPSSAWIPSSSVRSWLTTLSVTMLSPPMPLVGASASISSKKMMHGAACLALLKTSRTPLSDSPTHLLSSSGPLTLMKFASLSVATALASSVLPVPEGP